MQIFTDTKYDFIKRRHIAFVISGLVILAGLVSFLIAGGFNLGIDFTGGVRVQVKFDEPVDLNDLSTIREQLGMDVYTIGAADDEIIIRNKSEGSAERLAAAIVAYREDVGPIKDWEQLEEIEAIPRALLPYFPERFSLEKSLLQVTAGDDQRLVINQADADELASDIETLIERATNQSIITTLRELRPSDNYAENRFNLNDPVGEADYVRELERVFGVEDEGGTTAAQPAAATAAETPAELSGLDEAAADEQGPSSLEAYAAALTEARNLGSSVDTMRLLDSMDEALELARQAGLSAAELDTLEERAYVGAFQVQSTNVIGPKVGEELGSAALTSIIVALVLILAYISLRFEFSFALGAIVALAHDILLTLAIFVLLGKEIDLTFIAALLTLVGYSLNDTIVVFDRVREDRKLLRRRGMREIINTAINETLSRTVLTSGTTLIVTLVLVLFGGSVIHDFALALTIGVLVGTYSSIFIASPFLLGWYRWRHKQA